jgi:hypothetical protein
MWQIPPRAISAQLQIIPEVSGVTLCLLGRSFSDTKFLRNLGTSQDGATNVNRHDELDKNSERTDA